MRAVLRCTEIAADAEPHALGAQAGDVEQRRGRRRRRAVAVLPLGADVVDVGVRS